MFNGGPATILELFQSIDVPSLNAPANEAAIQVAEARLGGQMPAQLRSWFLEADGFEGEAMIMMWRFYPLSRLSLLRDMCRDGDEATIISADGEARSADPRDYVVICDQLINLPFFAVNLRASSSHHGEVVCALESEPGYLWLVDSTFAAFEQRLLRYYEDSLLLSM